MEKKEKLTLTLLVVCLVLCVVAILIAVIVDKNADKNDSGDNVGAETTVKDETTEYVGEPGDIDIDISELF